MDMSEPKNRREPNYSKTRFEPSGAPSFEVIRTLDGHIQPFHVELETDYDTGVDLANVYDPEQESW